MKLYQLTRKDNVNWDENEEMVVLANNAKEARQLASESAADEGSHVWKHSEYSECKVMKNTKARVLIVSNKGS